MNLVHALPKLWPWGKRTAAVVDLEVEAIVQELDAELARDHTLDEFEITSRDIGDVLRGFAQRCTKVAMVGSVRRGVLAPNDIDVLYVPKNNLQVVEFLEQIADDEKEIQLRDGRWQCKCRGTPMEFIPSTDRTWGMDMIYYTGSREFNEKVLRHVKRRGYTTVNEHGYPYVDKSDGYSSYRVPTFSGWSEEKILTHLGLQAYMDPHKRGSNGKVLTP